MYQKLWRSERCSEQESVLNLTGRVTANALRGKKDLGVQ